MFTESFLVRFSKNERGNLARVIGEIERYPYEIIGLLYVGTDADLPLRAVFAVRTEMEYQDHDRRFTTLINRIESMENVGYVQLDTDIGPM